jgi:hypothetical protein
LASGRQYLTVFAYTVMYQELKATLAIREVDLEQRLPTESAELAAVMRNTFNLDHLQGSDPERRDLTAVVRNNFNLDRGLDLERREEEVINVVADR